MLSSSRAEVRSDLPLEPKASGKLRLPAAAAAAMCITASAAWGADVRVPVAGGHVLVLSAPDGWRESRRPGPAPTVSLTPASGADFQVLVTPLVSAQGQVAPSSREALRSLVSSSAENAKSQAVEASLPIQELKSETVQGSYFSATDRAPKAGEFKYMTQGAMSVQGLPVAFTILSNGDPKATVEPALRMLRNARRE